MYKMRGITDSVTSCDCCGRSDLKSTVVLESDDGTLSHFGKVCASKLLKIGAKEVMALATAAKEQAQLAARLEEEAHPLNKKLQELCAKHAGKCYTERAWFLGAITPHLNLIKGAIRAKHGLNQYGW